jgi:hypothetical protein
MRGHRRIFPKEHEPFLHMFSKNSSNAFLAACISGQYIGIDAAFSVESRLSINAFMSCPGDVPLDVEKRNSASLA